MIHKTQHAESELKTHNLVNSQLAVNGLKCIFIYLFI